MQSRIKLPSESSLHEQQENGHLTSSRSSIPSVAHLVFRSIADSIESVVNGMSYDSLISVVGCDKNMPGALMAMIRLNRPSILVYGGTIAAGCYKGKKLDVVSAFEAWGEKVSGKLSNEDYDKIISNACPGPGACGGMYTANTMAAAIEAMGMCLPYNSSNPAASDSKLKECLDVGDIIFNLLENDLKPIDIVTY